MQKRRNISQIYAVFDSSMECRRILRLAYLWLTNVPSSAATSMTGHSNKTVSIFYRYFRSMVAGMVDEEDQYIGGEGVIVELDETKMGKRKYNRGHRVEGVWVLGGDERTSERRIFMARVDDRSSATILAVILKFVRPGSIVITDLWRSYSQLSGNLGLTHLTVNHSQTYKDKESSACTNTIEGTWIGLKVRMPPRNRVSCGIDESLLEFVWCRKNANNLWGHLF